MFQQIAALWRLCAMTPFEVLYDHMDYTSPAEDTQLIIIARSIFLFASYLNMPKPQRRRESL
ncbi:hypothetical protein BJX66DRAFT_297090 [Aspergillus keveii]|uniref:Uncharacterized protein n=1 Tax=Aspergillus keveii TaxID=714993 RepID=A0ABR4GFB1_9EURO